MIGLKKGRVVVSFGWFGHLKNVSSFYMKKRHNDPIVISPPRVGQKRSFFEIHLKH